MCERFHSKSRAKSIKSLRKKANAIVLCFDQAIEFLKRCTRHRLYLQKLTKLTKLND